MNMGLLSTSKLRTRPLELLQNSFQGADSHMGKTFCFATSECAPFSSLFDISRVYFVYMELFSAMVEVAKILLFLTSPSRHPEQRWQRALCMLMLHSSHILSGPGSQCHRRFVTTLKMRCFLQRNGERIFVCQGLHFCPFVSCFIHASINEVTCHTPFSTKMNRMLVSGWCWSQFVWFNLQTFKELGHVMTYMFWCAHFSSWSLYSFFLTSLTCE